MEELQFVFTQYYKKATHILGKIYLRRTQNLLIYKLKETVSLVEFLFGCSKKTILKSGDDI